MDAQDIRSHFMLGPDEEIEDRRVFNLLVEAVAQLAEASAALKDMANAYEQHAIKNS